MEEPNTGIPRSDKIYRMADYARTQNPGTPRPARDPAVVWYDLAVCHHADGTVETWVKGLDDQPDSKTAMVAALRQAADGIEDGSNAR